VLNRIFDLGFQIESYSQSVDLANGLLLDANGVTSGVKGYLSVLIQA
jgi:hypothetical protein